MTCQALLIDISAKQKYIFSSNKLKLNIGASHIIAKQVFGSTLKESLESFADTINTTFNFTAWQTLPDSLPTETSKICIGYVGGGNALVLFQRGVEVKHFIEKYSKTLIQKHRGISPVFALNQEFDTEKLQESRKKLNDTLNFNKSLRFTQTTPFKHGIESDCPLTGNAQEFYSKNVEAWVSVEAKNKIEAAKKSNEEIIEQYRGILQNYTFSDELEDISPESEKRYIAVVHIDGNGMGNLFKNIETLPKLRAKSKEVNHKLDATMQALIRYLIGKINIEKGEAKIADEITLKKEGDKWILPFRPIINAGDDITFVCHGKLGVHLAEKYIGFLNDKNIGKNEASDSSNNEKHDGIEIPSCGGVAIFHSKYPFSRIYDLSNQLANKAKIAVRGKQQSSLNFLVSSEGYMGDLEKLSTEIIDYQGNPLINQVYVIGSQFDSLKSQTRRLRKKWSKTKAIKLREMFFANEAEREEFAMQVKYRKIDDSKDIYQAYSYNAIELFDFYPESLL